MSARLPRSLVRAYFLFNRCKTMILEQSYVRRKTVEVLLKNSSVSVIRESMQDLRWTDQYSARYFSYYLCFFLPIFLGKWFINYENNQEDATMQAKLLFLVSSTGFGRCFHPSSGALDCILQHLLVFTNVAAGWCHRRVPTRIYVNNTRSCTYS